MANRRGDDAHGSLTSTGRVGKGSENGWSAERRDLKAKDDGPGTVTGWGADGKDVTKNVK